MKHTILKLVCLCIVILQITTRSLRVNNEKENHMMTSFLQIDENNAKAKGKRRPEHVSIDPVVERELEDLERDAPLTREDDRKYINDASDLNSSLNSKGTSSTSLGNFLE